MRPTCGVSARRWRCSAAYSVHVITHNRGTIQAADTIYGISMGEDSASQVVSLRLEGDRIAAPDGATIELEEGV